MVKILDKAKVDFIVKEEEGIVIARFLNTSNLAGQLADSLYKDNVLDWDYGNTFNFFEERARKVRGKAACSPEDKFDIKIGKKLALNKLKAKMEVAYLNRALKIRLNLATQIAELNHKISDTTKYLWAIGDRREKIYKLIESKN